MTLSILTAPSTTLNSFEFKFSFVGNPIYYDVQRKDTTITGVGSSGGNVAFNVGTGTNIYSVGDAVYVYASDGGVEILNAQYTVSYVGMIGLYNWIAIDLPTFSGYLGIDGGFVNNLERKNHRAIISLIANGVTTAERSFNTDLTGKARVYVNAIIADYISELMDIDYTAGNKLMSDYAVPFQLGYKEGWLGYTDTFPKFEMKQYYAVKAVSQIMPSGRTTPYDNRMTQYEVYYQSSAIYSTSKFLTAFVKPKMWTDYPFSLGALITNTVAPIDSNLKSYPVGTTDINSLDLTSGQGVYSLKLTPLPNSQKMAVWLSTDESVSPSINSYNTDYNTNYND